MAWQWRALSGALAALMLAAQAAAQPAAITPEELYDRIAPSIWLVQNDMGGGKGAIGSAVVIASGILVTNCHVVEGAQSLHVAHEQRRFGARLQYKDPTRDLCQLEAAGVDAPAVPIAAAARLHVGAKVYALGNPKGLELTLSDGLVSALRRDRQRELEYVQVSVPISPGSSGGGLFDRAGRLVGITTAGMKEGQNLNFALPAEWIVELPARAAGAPAVARLEIDEPPQAVAAAPAAPKRAASAARPAMPVALAPAPAPAPAIVATAPAIPGPEANAPWHTPAAAAPGLPNTFVYELRDVLTGKVSTVVYHVDRRDGATLVLNGGNRIEDAGGRVLALKTAIAGEFEQAMPPGGWVTRENASQPAWSSRYKAMGDGWRPYVMDLQAQPAGESVMRLQGRELRVVRIRFDGSTIRGGGAYFNAPGHYEAVAWFAPELDRVVHFEARTRGGTGSTAFVASEVLELVDIRTE